MAKKLTSEKALEILSDGRVHGKRLTRKQKKFFGAVAGGAEPYKAENGIEGTMGGLTDKGFNFNPAWGGAWENGGWMDKYADGGNLQPPMSGATQPVLSQQFAMGGSLPGSVGFTYARVAGAAPSEGPYAKKTLPSAQTGIEEPLTKSSADWFKQWYEQRQTLPQFSRVAGERLNLLSTLPKVQLTPMEDLQKFGAVAEYIKARSADPSQDILSLADPATIPAYAEKVGKPIDVNIGTDPTVVGHEMSHWLDARAKQYMLRPRGFDKSEPYERYPLVRGDKFKETGLDLPTYKWIASLHNPGVATGVRTEFNSVLNELRQREGLRGDQLTNPEQLKKIIDKYMNLPEDQLLKGTPEGSQNDRIRTLIKYLGGDPEKLSELNNRIVAAPQEGTPIAQNGAEMSFYQQGLDFKPKTISKNGGWLDKYDEDVPKAQKGITREQALERLRRQHEIYTQNRGDLAQQSGIPTQEQITRQHQIRKQSEDLKKKKEARARYEAMPKIGPAKQRNYSEQVQAEEQRRRLNQAYADQNPEVTVDESGDIVPSGYGRFMQTYGSNLDKFARSFETPLAIESAVSLAPLIGRGLATGARATGEYLRNAYTKIATGESALPIAWKSPAVGLSQVQQAGFPNPLALADEIIPMPLAPQNLLGLPGGWMELSPLNLLPGYGKKLSIKSSYPNIVGFRKFGNSLEDVIQRQALSPKGGSPLRIGRSQIVNEGNWAAVGAPDENYKGVFEATMNPQVEGSNIKLQRLGNRYGVVGTTKEGGIDIPLTDPGLSFNRRLPFSTRYVPIDKQKLINNQFQLATMAPRLQSLAEKYGVGLGIAGAVGGVETYNKYTIDPIIEQWKNFKNSELFKKKEGGEIIKDNEGYWNPENWGKVVEIDSPYITMQGVDQPLLGISDTGDVQYMEPGNDYEFDGTSVREYPVAQKGKAVQTSSRSTGPMKLSPSMPTAADSLALYNNALQVLNYYNSRNYKNRGSRQLTPSEKSTVFNKVLDKDFADVYELSKLGGLSEVPTTSGKTKKITGNELVSNYRKNVDKNKFHQRESLWSILDTRSPMQLYDRRISPTTVYEYTNMQGNDPLFSDWVDIHGYDPLAVKPYNMRTAKEKTEWDKKYGNKIKTQQKPKPKPVPPVKKETPKPLPKKEQPSSPERKVEKPQPKQEVVKKPEPVIEKKAPLTDYSQGIPVYAPTPYSPGAGAFVGYRTPQGDTVFVKPEDYERMGVPKYGREFIESKQKKQRNGGVSVNRADEYPLEKLDNLFNFTNYNKPKAKNGWLEKYK